MENYEILAHIGEGTYGVVLKARHKDTGEIVAIKKFKEPDMNEAVRKTAIREIRILRNLHHANIIRLIEHFRNKGKLYLVFEYVQSNLLQLIEDSGNGMDENEARKIMYQLLSATDYIHTLNVIHRDIKPENILISSNGVVKLSDFGFARTLSAPDAKYTDYVSTRWYRSPELLVGDTQYGRPCDIWAIGCLLAEMLTSKPLFPGESDIDQLYHIVRCLGSLSPHLIHVFETNPSYLGVQIPECTDPVPLVDRLNTLDSITFDFIHSCLYCDSDKRYNCDQLLDHRYFTDHYDQLLPELKEAFERDGCEFNVSKNKILPTLQILDTNNNNNNKSRPNEETKDNKENENKEEERNRYVLKSRCSLETISHFKSNEDDKHNSNNDRGGGGGGERGGRRHQRKRSKDESKRDIMGGGLPHVPLPNDRSRLVALPNIYSEYKEDDKYNLPIKPPSRSGLLDSYNLSDGVLSRNSNGKYRTISGVITLNPIPSTPLMINGQHKAMSTVGPPPNRPIPQLPINIFPNNTVFKQKTK